MSNRSYDKLKMENLELKEKLRAYESGSMGVFLEDYRVKVPKSFEQFYSKYVKRKRAWEKSSENVHKVKIHDEDLFDAALQEFFNIFPNVMVSFIMGEQTDDLPLSIVELDFFLKLGDGDLEKGFDAAVKRYGSNLIK